MRHQAPILLQHVGSSESIDMSDIENANLWVPACIKHLPIADQACVRRRQTSRRDTEARHERHIKPCKNMAAGWTCFLESALSKQMVGGKVTCFLNQPSTERIETARCLPGNSQIANTACREESRSGRQI